MGLFNKGELKDVEQAVLQKIMHSEFLDILIDLLVTKPEAKLMRTGTYGDGGLRRVIVEPYGLIIEKYGAYQRHDANNYIHINFVKSGYSQIEAHTNARGKTDISRQRMCYLYATAIQKRMEMALPNCTFENVTSGRDMDKLGDDGVILALGLVMGVGVKAEFEYYVPVPKSSSLF